MTTAYENPRDIALKLFREAGRAWNAENTTDMADHLFNFCVTHVALRDWVMVTLQLRKDDSDFHENWRPKADGLFGECADIANRSKHLKVVKQTAGLKPFREPLVAVGWNGEAIKGSEHERDSYQLERLNGDHLDLILLFHKVCIAWEECFSADPRLGDPLPSYMAFMLTPWR